jgi:NAD(P)-dependent dehydrogenase (short-subunit alcohol dehydrogenase family)
LAENNASVVIADINSKSAQEILQLITNNDRHLAIETDVSNSDSVRHLFNQISDHYNNKVATVLVNCAGIVNRIKLTEITEEEFDKVIAINLKGTFLTTQAYNRIYKYLIKSN